MKLKDVQRVNALTQKRRTVQMKLDLFKAGEVISIQAKKAVPAHTGSTYDTVGRDAFGHTAFWDFLKALVVDRLELDLKIIDAELYALGVEPDDD